LFDDDDDEDDGVDCDDDDDDDDDDDEKAKISKTSRNVTKPENVSKSKMTKNSDTEQINQKKDTTPVTETVSSEAEISKDGSICDSSNDSSNKKQDEPKVTVEKKKTDTDTPPSKELVDQGNESTVNTEKNKENNKEKDKSKNNKIIPDKTQNQATLQVMVTKMGIQIVAKIIKIIINKIKAKVIVWLILRHQIMVIWINLINISNQVYLKVEKKMYKNIL
jgi:hypothetical protein